MAADDRTMTRAEMGLEIRNNQFLGNLHNIVTHMQRTTNQIERFMAAYEKRPDEKDYLTGEHEALVVLRHVMAEVLWMVPNLHLDSLSQHAAGVAEAQRAVDEED